MGEHFHALIPTHLVIQQIAHLGFLILQPYQIACIDFIRGLGIFCPKLYKL